MVVEDESIISKDIQHTLKNLGYGIAAASSGKEAIQKVEEARPDLVLMDIVLKGEIDGIEAAEQIHSQTGVPIIYLSAYNDEKILQRAKITEPYGYLLKPFQERELHTTIEMALYKHQVEKKLREREQWFAATLNSVGDAVIATDASEKITYMNPVAEVLTEWEKQEVVGRPVTEIFHLINEESRGEVHNPVSRVIREDAVTGLENHTLLVTKSGQEIPIDDRAAPIKNDKGDLMGAVMVFRDITERKNAEKALRKSHEELEKKVEERTAELLKPNETLRAEINDRIRAEKALRESEAKFRVLTETTASAIFIIQGDRFRYVNPAFEKQTEYSFGELLEMSFWDMVHPDFQNLARERGLARQRGDSVPSRYEFKIVAKGGVEKWVDFTAGVIEYEGKPAMLGTAFDITERKQGEEALRLFQQAIEVFPLGLTITDARGTIIYTNPCEASTHGYRVEELIGKDVRVLAPRHLWNPMTTKQLLAMNRWKRESINIKKDGSVFPVQLLSAVATNLAGHTLGVITTCEDITERKRAEEARAALEEQLRQSQKMEAIGQLAGGVAHDFNNLLTVIQGYTDLILRDLDEKSRLFQDMKEIKKASERAASLTRQLLAFSRKQILQPRVLDLNNLVLNMEKMLRRMIGEDIELVTLLAENLGRVKADPGQIEQVILNLAVNSRDAMPNGGTLTIETAHAELDENYARTHIGAAPGCYVSLSVSDTGAGMTPEIKEKIFEPFFTTKETGQGTGLGLSTVYGIVKQSGGNISVGSEPDRGTSFKIYLPLIDEETNPQNVASSSTQPIHGTEAILLVEDEETVRKLAVTILQRNGYKVIEAPNGQEAIHLVRSLSPLTIQLMLTDVVMPGMSGRQLAGEIHSLQPGMKVLYMSGYTDSSIVHHGVLDPGTAYIQKPFTPRALALKVREVLDGA